MQKMDCAVSITAYKKTIRSCYRLATASDFLLLVELTETNSNNYRAILDFRRKHRSTPVNSEINPDITDTSYDPDSIIKTIKQQQKSLSDSETRTIIMKYQQGKSTYELAKEFGCHRYTISKALKDNGVEVTNQCAKKKVLAEMIMQMIGFWRPLLR